MSRNRLTGRTSIDVPAEPDETPAVELAAPRREPRRGPGRPPGKRSDDRYRSVTTFLLKDRYQEVQRRIVGTGQDFGDVVDELLAGWLQRNP